jgi:hypothetical protein
MSWLAIAILSACAILIILPPKHDPAIRFKEWIDKMDKTND